MSTLSLPNHEFRSGTSDFQRLPSRSSFTFSLIEATTRIWQGQKICLHNHELQRELQEIYSWSSIKQEATSVLDVRQFVNDIQVRHDLNFSRQMTFSSSSTCEQVNLARRYFEAVAFELVFHLAEYGKHTTCACGKKSSMKGIKKYTNQLPRFFKAVRQTMKALIRDEHWLIVEQAIDVDLLMNQLRNGTSDLFSLLIWLGDILKQSCSPIRDTDVDAVTTLLKSAMLERDGKKLANGITLLFDVFNTMKLDVANHQMRILLPPMVDESVEFVQKKYQEQMENGSLDYRSLWKWYHEKRELFEAKAIYEDLQDNNDDYEMETDTTTTTFPDEDFLTRYTEIVFAEIIKSNTPLTQLPEPFKLDLRRIDTIRRDVSRIFTQQCELMAFNIILRQCKHPSPPSLSEETNLLLRTAYIKSQLPSGPTQRDALAIEIVRTAYQISNHPTHLPEPLHTCQVKDMLNPQTRAGEVVADTIRTKLYHILEEMVFEEINGSHGISDLLPSQILDRYYGTTAPSTSTIGGTSADAPHADTLASEIRSIAQRLAHITLMQWRVWAQMLWFKSYQTIFTSEAEFREWKESVARGIQMRYPKYMR